MIGTGSMFSRKYYNNNALIRSGGFNLMIDCGFTASRALHEMGLEYGQIDGVLITHLHGDHTGGLEELGFRMKFIYRRKMPLYLSEKLVGPLWEHCLQGTMGDGGANQLTDFFDIRILPVNVSYRIADGLDVTLIPTKHVPGKDSYSLLINDRFFYSADCTFDPQLLLDLYRRGVRLFFHECQLNPPAVVHTALDELRSLPPELQEHIWLMHYDDNKDDFLDKVGPMRFVEQHRTYPIG
jgi:glyoxylase-like metal-dependent hydrolase (beta-lactamase superfamily II)